MVGNTMEEDAREMRRSKPQQQLYRPGSGPLKKSPMSPDEAEPLRLDRQDYQHHTEPPRRGQGRHRNRGHNSHKDSNRFNEDLSERLSNVDQPNMDDSKMNFPSRRPEQQIYTPKFGRRNDDSNMSPQRRVDMGSRGTGNGRYDDSHSGFVGGQDHHEIRSKRYSGNRRQGGHEGDEHGVRRGRDMRQASEPRPVSPGRKGGSMDTSGGRGRDTRSVDLSRHHHSNGNKPPSGRRSSAMGTGINIDSLPPRLKKKFLENAGRTSEYQGQFYNQPPAPPPPSWSQTLPTRGRGRLLQEDAEKYRHATNTFLQTLESGSDSRSSTPHAPLGPPFSRPQFTDSQENIYSEKTNYPNQNRQHRPDDYITNNYSYPNYRPQAPSHVNQQINYNDRGDTESSTQQSHRWGRKSESLDDISKAHNTHMPQHASKIAFTETNTIEEVPNSNRLLESITSSIKSLTVECDAEILDWSKETENVIPNTNYLPPQNVVKELHPVPAGRIQEQQFRPANVDIKNNDRAASHPGGGMDTNSRHLGNTVEGQGRSSQKHEGRGGRHRRRKRSSSRGSQRRELSNDLVQRARSERSPHSQQRDVRDRDHYRDSKEPHHREPSERDGRSGHQQQQFPPRNDYIEMDRPPSRGNWNRGQYSRDNSRDRYSFSRASSGERPMGPGSRGSSRERIMQGSRVRMDSEGFRLPPPPPSNQRNSRNQVRRDSWSARGSRHGSVESGGGDHSPLSSRVAGGGGGGGGGVRRRRRRDSDRHAGSTPAPNTNWRDEMPRTNDRREPEIRSNPVPTSSVERSFDHITSSGKSQAPGIIVLPHDTGTDRTRNMDMDYHQNTGSSQTTGNNTSPQTQTIQRTLFNPSNPSKPIVVSQLAAPTCRGVPPSSGPPAPADVSASGHPSYYDPNSASFKSCHNQELIREVQRVDLQLQAIFKNCTVVQDWERITRIRPFLQHALKTLLSDDLKFCEAENVEHHFWKMLYYSYIEFMRKSIAQDEANKSRYKEVINSIIKDGNTYLESLLELLQVTYKFKLEDYLNISYQNAPKASGYVSLALISAQKIYLFLGDLARYKELVNETTNYAKSKSWYTKAHQINPKNGRPYNQLAILAVYARRKIDAVYYYMRSLMSSNPCHSAQESLNALFDENRKKYETNERKRQVERQKSAENNSGATPVTVAGGWRGGLRREVWIRAGRTTTLLQPEKPDNHSDEEDLSGMTSVELNKRFIISYLHVHGKLITKIGLETFSSSAGVMLRQFRALLRHSPLPINCGRLLQLTALNMFAIHTAYNKDSKGGGCRRALAVSLRMFGALAGRCCSLLSMPQAPNQPLPVHEDVLVILPALKVWSDWMLFHSSVWNPPPSCDDFDVDANSDPWEQLAKLMNLLEPLDLQENLLRAEPADDHEAVRLPEDTQLSGFTPLMYGTPTCWYAPRILEPEGGQLAARASALLFLGTQFLCGTDPPALERRLTPEGVPEYISVVQTRREQDLLNRSDSSGDLDLMEASLSEEEEEPPKKNDLDITPVVDWAACVEEPDVPETTEGAEDETTRNLLKRRGELETRRQDMERRKQKMQSMLKLGQVSVELEVRPRLLVPDTNCFIDHLPRLQRILTAEVDAAYTLVVPLVVVAELEGLTRAARVADDARAALEALRARRPALRFATTRGSLLTTPTFTAEQDGEEQMTNDDKILTTSLNLCKMEGHAAAESNAASCGVRRLVREVVLLTEDRNLRVKALSRDLPVRDLPAFMRWAALD